MITYQAHSYDKEIGYLGGEFSAELELQESASEATQMCSPKCNRLQGQIPGGGEAQFESLGCA